MANVNTLHNFVEFARRQNSGKEKSGAVQITENGVLYVSKPRRKAAALLIKIYAKLREFFGSKDFSADLRIDCVNRQKAAVNEFQKIYNNLRVAGDEQVADLSNCGHQFNSPESYNNFLQQQAVSSKVITKALNRIIFSELMLVPEEIDKTHYFSLPNGEGLALPVWDSDNLRHFADIYNSILEHEFAGLKTVASAEDISSIVNDSLNLIKKLAGNPDLCQRFADYNAATECYLYEIHEAFTERDFAKLAAAKIKLCCVHNDFMHHNAKDLGFKADSGSADEILRQNVDRAVSALRADYGDSESVNLVIQSLQQNQRSQVSQEASRLISEIARLEHKKDAVDDELFKRYAEQVGGVPSVEVLVDQKPLEIIKNISATASGQKSFVSLPVDCKLDLAGAFEILTCEKVLASGVNNYLRGRMGMSTVSMWGYSARSIAEELESRRIV